MSGKPMQMIVEEARNRRVKFLAHYESLYPITQGDFGKLYSMTCARVQQLLAKARKESGK